MRMRTIDQASAYLKVTDPDTALTKTALRRLVTSGKLPSVMVGAKYLVALEAIDDYLAGGGVIQSDSPPRAGEVRPVAL